MQWTDIDLYHAYRDFTTDPVSFPAEEVQRFIGDLVRAILGIVNIQFNLRLLWGLSTGREQPIL